MTLTFFCNTSHWICIRAFSRLGPREASSWLVWFSAVYYEHHTLRYLFTTNLFFLYVLGRFQQMLSMCQLVFHSQWNVVAFYLQFFPNWSWSLVRFQFRWKLGPLKFYLRARIAANAEFQMCIKMTNWSDLSFKC